MRSDARVRREALLAAAEACFRESGFLVPLEKIAERAGVGRGTLYRNFKDRVALALAIFDREVDMLGNTLDLALPFETALADYIRRGVNASALFQRISADIPFDAEYGPAFRALADRVIAFLTPLVDKAHADGALRPEIGAADILMATRMISGIVLPQMSEAETDIRIREALELLMRGLAPK